MPMFKYEKRAGWQSFARKADMAMAWMSVPFAAVVTWLYWGTAWPLVAVAMIPASFLLARYDWKAGIEERVQTFFIKRMR